MPQVPGEAARAGGGSGVAEEGRAEQTQDKAKEVAGQAQEKAKEAGQQAKSRLQDQLDHRSTDAGGRVRTAAEDARSVAEQLRSQGKETPAKFAEQAADRAERVGNYLTEADGERMLSDVEDFARRNTWAVAAGGLLLGLAASRMLKASSTERYRSSQSAGRSLPAAGGGVSNGQW